MPGSPGKRRQCFLELEENEGEMTIEDFIHRSDAYRSSTTSISFSFELKTTIPADDNLTEVLESNETFRNGLGHVFNDHNISTNMVAFRLHSKPGYPGDDDKSVLTLVVSGVTISRHYRG